jgi:hypothetical protein
MHHTLPVRRKISSNIFQNKETILADKALM